LLRERRLERGLTQQQLADRVLMTKSQISDYENKRYILKVPAAKVIADTLGCLIEDLYEWPEASRNRNG
jgi:transcriptional regulator with XRE-family HTH domain